VEETGKVRGSEEEGMLEVTVAEESSAAEVAGKDLLETDVGSGTSEDVEDVDEDEDGRVEDDGIDDDGSSEVDGDVPEVGMTVVVDS
jgi:hypothetical protein